MRGTHAGRVHLAVMACLYISSLLVQPGACTCRACSRAGVLTPSLYEASTSPLRENTAQVQWQRLSLVVPRICWGTRRRTCAGMQLLQSCLCT